MLTISSAARLLAGAHDTAGLVALARAAGFVADPAPLDAAARATLGIPSPIRTASVLEGHGITRALCAVVPHSGLTRDAAVALTQRLQRKAPFSLWLVFLTERGGPATCIAAARAGPRMHTSYLMVDRTAIVDSDSDTVRALAGAVEGLDIMVHDRWCEILGREALTNRFFRSLDSTVGRLAASISRDAGAEDARSLALLTTTRLLFLAFLEAKGWLDGDHGFLRRTWDGCMAARGGYHRNVLTPLCFGTLNTPRSKRASAARAFGRIPFLNGGLFNRSELEKRHRRALFPDDALGTLVADLLGGWRFTVREHTSTQSEAAVDPEMLGRAFESLMASRDRRSTGTYYTPRALVTRVFDAALDAALAPGGAEVTHALRALRSEIPVEPFLAARMSTELARVRILDPACGSGAFLVHALEELSTLRARAAGTHDLGGIRRDILARQIFGVDRAPTAVWLCELRLWLAVVVETIAADPASVPPLPNLDAQVRIGDALAGDAFASSRPASRQPALSRLRERYARATGTRKRTLSALLARAERQSARIAIDARLEATSSLRRELVTALRGRDLFGARLRADVHSRVRLETLRRAARELRAERNALANGGAVAFDFAAQFGDVGAQGGFDLVIGNPPWVRLHRIPARERVQLRERFVAYRDAGWRAGAALAGASVGFAAQVDLAALFVERSLSLARPGGALSLLVPAKLWRSLAGAGVRQLLTSGASLCELEDWSEARATFDAAVYPSLVVATRDSTPRDVLVGEHHRDNVLRWTVSRTALPFDATIGAPWLWLPAEPRTGFDLLRAKGSPLAERERMRPRLGVKCGCNEAFIVGPEVACDRALEPALLRPVLRGDGVAAWRPDPTNDRIIFAHDAALRPLRELPPNTRRWLQRFRGRLESRSDCRGRMPWWSVFRVDAASARTPRVVWADLARTPRASVLPAGDPTIPLNTCYVVRAESMDEAHALAAWLNSPLAAAWLAALAEPARGGFRRMLGWTVGLLPLPRDWERAIDVLAPLGERGTIGDAPSPDEMLHASLDAFGMAHSSVESLLTWGHR